MKNMFNVIYILESVSVTSFTHSLIISMYMHNKHEVVSNGEFTCLNILNFCIPCLTLTETH